MIGTVLRGKPRLYTATMLFGILTLMLWVFAAIYHNESTGGILLIMSLIPLCLTLSYLGHRVPGFEAEIREDGLHFISGKYDDLPFTEFIGVMAEQKAKAKTAVHVLHERGVFSIPPQRDIEARELMTFLVSRLNEHDFACATNDLKIVLQNQVAKFGADQVYVYLPRRHMVKRLSGRGLRAFSVGCMFAGLLLITAAAVWGFTMPRAEPAPLIGMGMFLFLVATLLLVVSSSNSTLRGGHRKWHQSGVVITPQGMALIQDTLRGEMLWGELRKLVFPTKRRSFESIQDTRIGSISLEFSKNEGVEIFDIYNHPLEVIHARIKQYWQPVV